MAPKSFYNLPPSWNPGYAIPESVRDEGLERHAFVTAQAPRGTYDRTTNGQTAGYAIPQYIKEESVGRGAITTAMLPRGYYGPRVPQYLNRQKRFGMGDSEAGGQGGAAFTQYGQEAARVIMANLSRITPALRTDALRTMLNQIDSGLYARVELAASTAVGRGVRPGAALEFALSTSLTDGILAELKKVGESRSAPQSRSLLGLGCYGGREALGAVASPNPPVGFTWDAAAGAFRRMRAGETPVPSPLPPGTIDVRDSRGQPAQHAPTQGRVMQIGPWQLPMTNGSDPNDVGFVRVAESVMTPAQRQALGIGIADVWRHLVANGALFMKKTPTFLAPGAYKPPAPIVKQWLMANTGPGFVQSNGKVVLDTSITKGKEPIFGFEHPVTHDKWGVYASCSDPYAADPSWTLTAHKQGWDGNVFGSIWGAIKKLVATVVDVVGDVADAIGDIACKAVNTPGAAAGAAAAHPAAAVGVVITGSLCGPGTPQYPPPMEMPSILMPLAIGGAALIAITLYKKHKKGTSKP